MTNRPIPDGNPALMWRRVLDRKDFLKLMAVGSAAMAAVPILGCGEDGDSGSGEGVKTLRVGLTPYQDYYVILVGEEQGYWEEEGLRLEIQNISFENISEVIASGSVDISANNDSTVLAAQARYPDLVQSNLFFLFLGGAIMVRPDDGFTTYEQLVKEGKPEEDAIREACAQLRGKEILTSINTDLEQTVIVAAREGGLVYGKDVKVQDGPIDANLAAFLQGTGDGFVGGLPERTRAAKEGAVPLIGNSQLGAEATTQGGWGASEKVVMKDPQSFVKFQRVTYRSLQFIEKNPDEGLGIIVDKLASQSGAQYTVEDLKNLWNKPEGELFPPTGLDTEKEIFTKEANFYWRKRYDFLLDLYQERDVLKSPVDLDRVVPFQWIQAAYMEQFEPEAWKELGSAHPSGDLSTPPAEAASRLEQASG
jgi:ABC-type nitrate/sulfonate/bicarbonate transport system substrate-binding protein